MIDYFESEINKFMKLLNEILKDKKNFNIPPKTKSYLLELIKKSENNWNLTYLEQNRNQIIQPLYENSNNDEFNNIKNKIDNNSPFK